MPGKTFTLQDKPGHCADAKRSVDRLRTRGIEGELAAELAPRMAEIELLLQSDKPRAASATLLNPCNRVAGQPLG